RACGREECGLGDTNQSYQTRSYRHDVRETDLEVGRSPAGPRPPQAPGRFQSGPFRSVATDLDRPLYRGRNRRAELLGAVSEALRSLHRPRDTRSGRAANEAAPSAPRRLAERPQLA